MAIDTSLNTISGLVSATPHNENYDDLVDNDIDLQNQINLLETGKADVTYVDSQDAILQGQITTLGTDKANISYVDSQDAILQGQITVNSSDISDLDGEYNAHIIETMPHQFQNLKTGKTYRYGYRISDTGTPQLIYEEVI